MIRLRISSIFASNAALTSAHSSSSRVNSSVFSNSFLYFN